MKINKLVLTSLISLSIFSLSSCSENKNSPAKLDNNIAINESRLEEIPECNFVGHGVDFANGVITYRMKNVLQTTFETFEALIKINQDTKGTIGSIISNNTKGLANYMAVEVTEEGYLKFDWNGGEGSFIFDEYNLKNNKWNFVSLVRDKENRMVSYYVNGVLVKQISTSLSDIVNRAKYYFGSDPRTWSGSKLPFQGQIKYVYGYRTARDENQIKDDFENLNKVSFDTRGSELLFSYDFLPLRQAIDDKSGFTNDLIMCTSDYYYERDLYETKDYTLSVIGDPQMIVTYHDHYGSGIGALDTTMDYILDHVDDQKIDMTICVGDLSNMQNSSSDAQKKREWDYVGKTFARLDNRANYIVTPGNHDYDTICKVDHQLNYMNAEGRFPLSKFKEFDYYGGSYDDVHIQNTYYLLETGGVKYCFICMDFGPADEVLEWADTVCKAYPDRRVIIVTHNYLSGIGDIAKKGDPDNPSAYGWSSNPDITVNDPIDIYNKLIYPNDNVFMVFSGHVVTDDILYHESVTKGGNTVLEFVVNAQGLLINDGLDALLGLFTFDELNQEVYIDYYSTYFRKSFNIQNHYSISFKGKTHLLSSLYYNEDGTLKEGE